jgi:predicted amino acid-binding ACT domain protein
MLCNIENSNHPFKEIKDGLVGLGEELGMEIWVQKKEIFDNMHKM